MLGRKRPPTHAVDGFEIHAMHHRTQKPNGMIGFLCNYQQTFWFPLLSYRQTMVFPGFLPTKALVFPGFLSRCASDFATIHERWMSGLQISLLTSATQATFSRGNPPRKPREQRPLWVSHMYQSQKRYPGVVCLLSL